MTLFDQNVIYSFWGLLEINHCNHKEDIGFVLSS